ncbi:MAG: hypothetical protein LBU51_10260 [Bacteroidales bacterium]|jgi:nitrogen regulatory protein PII|nr:hypothetical protein [Bacteroidales bacterium]
MKAVFIIFNQSNTERVQYMFDRLNIKGYTWWENVQGSGTVDGEPRHGTHTWPEMNSACIVVVADEMVPTLLESVEKLDHRNTALGVRAFVWNIEQMV